MPRVRLKPKVDDVNDVDVAATVSATPSPFGGVVAEKPASAVKDTEAVGDLTITTSSTVGSSPQRVGSFGGIVAPSQGPFGGVVAPKAAVVDEATTMFGGVVRHPAGSSGPPMITPPTELIPPIDGRRVGEPLPLKDTRREVSNFDGGGSLLPGLGTMNGPVSSQADIDALLLDSSLRTGPSSATSAIETNILETSSPPDSTSSNDVSPEKLRLVPTRERKKPEPVASSPPAPKKLSTFEFLKLPIELSSADDNLYGDRFASPLLGDNIAETSLLKGTSRNARPSLEKALQGVALRHGVTSQSPPTNNENSLAQLKRSLQMDVTTSSSSSSPQQNNGTAANPNGPTSKLTWLPRPQSSNFLSGANSANNRDNFSLWSRHDQTLKGGSQQQRKLQEEAAKVMHRRRRQPQRRDVNEKVQRLKHVLHKTFPKRDASPLPDGSGAPLHDKGCTLQELIRNMQNRNMAAKSVTPAAVAAEEPKIPDWRSPLPKRGFLVDGMANTPPVAEQDKEEVQPEEPKHKPIFVDPKQQEVTIPFYDTSLVEASLLFRVKTAELIASLERIGSRVPKGEERKKFKLKQDAMELIAIDLGQKYTTAQRPVVDDDASRLMQHRAVEAANQPSRPPVVSVMGHVDHGKTTLMDALRRKAGVSGGATASKKSKKKKKESKKPVSSGNVAGTEAGGITQVITAFQVPLLDPTENGRDAVTFLDTPGHAAFKAMRQSGSDAADIIVLVVAADDGVSPQTIEILDFYKSIVRESGESGISLVVALNKIDKPGIDADESMIRVSNQLLEQGIVTEKNVPSDPAALDGFEIYGPPVQIMPVSGLHGTGIDDLVESLALQSEVMDLRADDKASAEGVIMDAKIEKGLGVVASCIIRWGSLAKGDIIVSGNCTGKVRILKDVAGKQIKEGMPSQPVQLVGFDEVPKAGDPFICVDSDQTAQDMVARRNAMTEGEKQDQQNDREETKSDLELHSSGRDMMNHDWKVTLEQKHGVADDNGASANEIRIPILIKADADGTLAAVRESLVEIGSNATQFKVVVDPIVAEVGPLLGSEIELAKESNAAVFCFNVKPDGAVSTLATEQEVSIFDDKVIYRLIDAAKLQFAKYLPPEQVDVVHGRAKVQKVFSIGGIDDKVAGSMVLDGQLLTGRHYRVVRDGKTISDRPLEASSLKHFKEDVDEVSRGQECGLALRGFGDIQEGDEVECYTVETRYPEL